MVAQFCLSESDCSLSLSLSLSPGLSPLHLSPSQPSQFTRLNIFTVNPVLASEIFYKFYFSVLVFLFPKRRMMRKAILVSEVWPVAGQPLCDGYYL